MIGDGYRGAEGRAFAAGRAPIAHEQGLAGIVAEYARAGVWISEEESPVHLLAGVVRMSVELEAIAEQVAEIAEELEVVVDFRRAPDLGRIANIPVAGRDQSRRVATLDAAIARRGVAVFEAEVGKPGGAERQPHVAGESVTPAPSVLVDSTAELDTATGWRRP